MVRTMKATLAVAVVVALLAGATNAQIITNVVRTNGQTGDRPPIGAFDGNTTPLATEAGGLMDGNMVFSDREYPWAGTPAELTPTEFTLLATMARQPGRIFTRSQLLDAVHGVAFESYERAIDTHVKNVRRKIEPNPREPRYVLTVYGVGYRVAEPEG